MNDPHVYDYTSPAGMDDSSIPRQWRGSGQRGSAPRDSLSMIFAVIGLPVGILKAVSAGSIPMLFVGALLGAVIGYALGWSVAKIFHLLLKIPRTIIAAIKGQR